MNHLAITLLCLVPSHGASDTGRKIQQPEVDGYIATPVRFPGASARKVADAAVALLASCHYSHQPGEGKLPEWDDVLLDCINKQVYLHVRIARPRVVKTREAPQKPFQVAELVIVLRGPIWVREKDKARRFGKYGHDAVVRLQTLLGTAKPVHRAD